ncbi:MAG: helix-turn-helix domain-containing protein [Polaribacter sp.]
MIFESTLDFILLFGISIGLFISTTLLFVKKQNNKANKILAFVLILSVMMLLGRLFFLRYYKDILLFRIGTIVDGTVFIFGPLVLMFFKTLLFKDDKNKKLIFWYFIPALTYLCFAIYTFSLDNKIFYTKVTTGQFNKFFFIVELLGILTNSFFVYKSFIIIKKYKQIAVKQISFNQNIIRFSNYFIGVYTFILLSWIVSFINTYFLKSYSKVINYDVVWISIPVLIYIIGFYVLTQPEIFKVKPKSATKKNTANRLSEEKIAQLKIDIATLLKEEKLYHKSDLSLPDLAKELEVSNNDLSWFINTICKTNFYEFINTYRIEEFIERVKNGDYQKHTIAAVSMDVGFNSKSTFYKAFKLITNTTPVAYINKLNLKG